jgi:hypothetical protein
MSSSAIFTARSAARGHRCDDDPSAQIDGATASAATSCAGVLTCELTVQTHILHVTLHDELILFNALFDVWDTPESLLPVNFATAFNLPYTHDLDTADVRTTIGGLIERGLIQSRVGRSPQKRSRGSLRAAGGELWTLEREPAWDRSCDTMRSGRPGPVRAPG